MFGDGAEQKVHTITEKGIPVTAYTSTGDSNYKDNMKIKDVVEVNVIDDQWHKGMDKRVLKVDSDGDNRNDMYEKIAEREADTAEEWIYNGDDKKKAEESKDVSTTKKEEDF